jgi:hypothetical protein
VIVMAAAPKPIPQYARFRGGTFFWCDCFEFGRLPDLKETGMAPLQQL